MVVIVVKDNKVAIDSGGCVASRIIQNLYKAKKLSKSKKST